MARILNVHSAIGHVEMLDFEAEARRVVEEAHKEAREIIAAARRDVEAIKEKGHKEGYAVGLKEGAEVGRKEGIRRAEEDFTARSQELSAALEGVLSEFASRKERMLEQFRLEALDFLLACVERIIRRHISIDQDVVRRSLEEGLSLVTASPVQVEVNPSDLEFLRRILPEVMAEKVIEGVTITANDELESGGVKITHPEGAVDLSVRAQLEVLRTAFTGGGDDTV